MEMTKYATLIERLYKSQRGQKRLEGWRQIAALVTANSFRLIGIE